ncbi:ATP-binding response regulator [Holophaga foetida]|uniref:ATP-binding response regulator n=1 Tax=Holophaga foetida TaxID=35839 RepID=UPI0002471C75|nr:ATP-binding protein [Holophaga foetida]
MQNGPLKILLLEDSLNDAFLIEQLLGEHLGKINIIRVDNREDYLRELGSPDVSLVLSDYSLPSYNGLEALTAKMKIHPELPFIFVSGVMGEDLGVECMKVGATDYIFKSNLKRLPSAVHRALEEMHTRRALLEAARVAKVVPWIRDEEDGTWVFGYLVKDVLGYTHDTLNAEPELLKSIVHPADLSRFISSFTPASALDRTDFDCRIQHADGRWIWTRWTLAWSACRFRGILQDITELHVAQDALIQSQRLENLGMMIGGITHDFGNLIGSMRAAAELLAMSQLTEKQQRHVEILVRSCERAQEFKTELLRLARKEDAPVRVDLDLNDVTEEAAILLRHALPKGIELSFQPGEGIPRVRAVPSQILQVLMNLGINARDAMGSQGRITLRTIALQLQEAEASEHHRPGGTYACVEVQDTGPGIPAEVLSHMFEAFYTTKDEGKGTGLGLAMARAIAQQHDGLIQVETGLGKGTRFRVLLPLG